MRVLIAEDNPMMCRYLKRLIETFSPIVCECSNGAEAVSMYEDFRPDVVLMDICMPVMDGLAALQRIVGSHPGASVLMVTEHDEAAYRRAAEAGGAAAFFVKDRLQDVHAWLAERAGRAADS